MIHQYLMVGLKMHYDEIRVSFRDFFVTFIFHTLPESYQFSKLTFHIGIYLQKVQRGSHALHGAGC